MFSRFTKAFFFWAAFVSLPFFAFAQTSSPAPFGLQALVRQLEAQIKALQAQVMTLQLEAKEELLVENLRRGATGDEVRKLQEFLKRFPDVYPEGLVTGYFGPLTEAAVGRFQAKKFRAQTSTPPPVEPMAIPTPPAEIMIPISALPTSTITLPTSTSATSMTTTTNSMPPEATPPPPSAVPIPAPVATPPPTPVTETATTSPAVPVAEAPPSAPSNFAVSLAANGTDVNLSWSDNSTNESKFEIGYGHQGYFTGTFSVFLGANTTSYVVTDQPSGSTYEYLLQACNASGCSPYSKVTLSKISDVPISGACTLRGGGASSPSFSFPNVGYQYAKLHKPGINDRAALRGACAIADYDYLVQQYCTQNTLSSSTPAFQEVVFYNSDGTPAGSGGADGHGGITRVTRTSCSTGTSYNSGQNFADILEALSSLLQGLRQTLAH